MKFKKYFDLMVERVDLLNSKTKDYSQKTLKQGANVEKEHTNNKEAAKTIAKQHMAEFPKEKDDKVDSDYYDELETLEKKLKPTIKKSFKDILEDVVKENMVSGGVTSMFGSGVTSTETQFSGDNYATGDARNLFGTNVVGRKPKGKKKRRTKSKVIMPIQRRMFPNL